MRRIARFLFLSGLACMGHAAGDPSPASPAGKPPARPAKAVMAVADATNDFALELYHRLAMEKENAGKNLFFSPYSVSVALTMAAEGARGETAEQMGRVLHFPPEAKRTGKEAGTRPWRMEMIHRGMSGLRDRLHAHEDSSRIRAADAEVARLRGQIETLKAGREKDTGTSRWAKPSMEYLAGIEREKTLVARLNGLLVKTRQYDLKVANSLWAENQYPFKPEYFDAIGKYYGTGGVFPADFRNQPAAERLRINGWVEERTEQRIKDLIPDGGITEDTRLVLVNAIYFKGQWSTPFKEKETKARDFTLAGAGKVKVPTLHAPTLDSARYAAFNADGSYFETPSRRLDCLRREKAAAESTYPDSGGFVVAELDYKGKELSMVVLVPNHPALLAGLEKRLTRENLARWLGRLQSRPVEVFLPKFKVETEYTLGKFNETKVLQKMGMTRAFKDPRFPGGAQFDGMSNARSPSEKLAISLVIHKAFVEVNEKGTEAAAATAVVMMRVVSGTVDCRFTPQVRADRPFVYLIRHRATGTILFLGRMMDPS